MTNSFFKSVPRRSTHEHPLEDEQLIVSAVVDNSTHVHNLVISPLSTSNIAEYRSEIIPMVGSYESGLTVFRDTTMLSYLVENEARWNAESSRRFQEFYNSLNYVQMERHEREMRRLLSPGMIDLINRPQNEYIDTRAQRPARPESDFASWWARPETQQRYQQSCSELAVRKEDLNPSRLDPYTIDIPEEFICPLSYEIITTPVYDPRFPQHRRCELLSMKTWLDEKHTNPFNREALSIGEVVCDEALKCRIDNFVRTAILNGTSASSRPEAR